jgi:hypothetical protein
MVRLEDGGASLRCDEAQFWGKNAGATFGKVFESWKTYKNLQKTYKKWRTCARISW